MIPAVCLPPGDQWDQNMLVQLLAGRLYPHILDIEICAPWPDSDGIILIIPGRYWADRTGEITAAIARYRWVLAIRTSDEESWFDITRVEHPNLRWWVQTPRTDADHTAHRLWPLGFPAHFNQLPPAAPKHTDVFLAAQNTHGRRRECFAALDKVERRKVVHESAGFTQGLPVHDYAGGMRGARVAPCPSGAVTPESFRFYEALESHAVPIADDITPAAWDSTGYWRALIPNTPVPILTDYADLPGYIDDALRDWPRVPNRVAAWWIRCKRDWALNLEHDFGALAGGDRLAVEHLERGQDITVLVSSSPILSHPDTGLLEETIESVRERLPRAEIVLMFDGVRPEQEHLRTDYERYIARALELADHRWRNVLPIIFDDHLHQGECTKRALADVRTPMMLFVEHDTPLTGGVPFDDLAAAVRSGDANVIRLHHESRILEPHRHLMLDAEPQIVRGVPMQRTIQWSQRPHLASVAWYRGLLDRCFPDGERDFIEDKAYGRLIVDHDRDGEMGWLGWRCWIYTPEGNIQRSYHTDGRNGAEKYAG